MANLNVAMIAEGAPLHARNLVNNLQDVEGYDFTFYPTQPRQMVKLQPGLTAMDTIPLHQYTHVDWSKIDVLWNMGFFFDVDQLFWYVKRMYPRIQIVNHWIGTDILNTVQLIANRPKCQDCILYDTIDLHLVDDHSFTKELHDHLDLATLFVPTLPARPLPFTPFPDKFAVGAYLPFYKRDFYRFDNVFQLALQFPDVPFYVFSLDEWTMEGVPENVQFTGKVEPENKEEIWGKCAVFISIPIHGGLGVTAIEMAQMGRWVITDKDYPHTLKCESLVQMKQAIENIRIGGEADQVVSDYYHQEYSKETLVQCVLGALHEIT